MTTAKNQYSRRYSPKVKFQAVLEVLEGKDVGQVSRVYGIHPTSLGHWKRRVLENGPELFSTQTTVKQYEKKITQLENLLGKKELEIAFLKNFLGQTS
jgi:transposase-like protein